MWRVDVLFALLLSIGEKRAGTVFRGKKKRKIYGGNRFRNIKTHMAGTHFLIGIGNQIGKIGSKKGPESGIPAEFRRISGGFPNQGEWTFTVHF